MRVLTLNLWCRHGDWPARRAILRDGLRELNPDLAVFQESVVVDGYDQIRDIMGDGYEVLHQAGRCAEGSGASIASRWPIVRVTERALKVSERLDQAHGWIAAVAVAEIAVPPPIGSILLAHHKPSWQYGFERERELQAVAAARLIESLVVQEPMPVVLAGDFDATPQAASMRFWYGLQSLEGMSVCYRACPTPATFSPVNTLVRDGEMPQEQGRTIDHLLVRCNEYGPTLTVTQTALAFDKPVAGMWASDHFGVWADLEPLMPSTSPLNR